MNFDSEGDVSLKPKRSAENSNGCFDCNICLDSSHDPVVTLCGHLYCWPCIYKWLQVQTHEQPKCPVCKAYITSTSLIPLYGRGTSSSEIKKPQLDSNVPQRPSAIGMSTLVPASGTSAHHNPNPFREYFTMTPPPTIGGNITTGFSSPTANMVGEMMFARMFGSSDSSLFGYPYSNSYSFPGNGSPRVRRQEMQLNTSLNRVYYFFVCCFVFCLILF